MDQTQTSSSALFNTMSVAQMARAMDTHCRVDSDATLTIDAGRNDDVATSRAVELVERTLHALHVMSAR